MATVSASYRAKTTTVLQIIADLGCTWNDILQRYVGTKFASGYEKSEIFQSLLDGDFQHPGLVALNLHMTKHFEHIRGNRTGLEYAFDLVLGWIVEDAFDEAHTRLEIEHELSGADSDRNFLAPSAISANSDFIVGNPPRSLELASDYSGHWKNYDSYDLRDSKFEKLVAQQSKLFLLDGPNRRAGILDLANGNTVKNTRIPMHIVYKKPATRILEINSHLMDIGTALQSLKDLVT